MANYERKYNDTECQHCGRPLEIPSWKYCDEPECNESRKKDYRNKKKLN